MMQRLMWIGWPAFLVAGLLEMLVFATLDPRDVSWLADEGGLSRQTIYTLAFFVFWILSALSSALTLFLAQAEHGAGLMGHLPAESGRSAH